MLVTFRSCREDKPSLSGTIESALTTLRIGQYLVSDALKKLLVFIQ